MKGWQLKVERAAEPKLSDVAKCLEKGQVFKALAELRRVEATILFELQQELRRHERVGEELATWLQTSTEVVLSAPEDEETGS